MPSGTRNRPESNAGTWLALLGLLGISGGLFFLAAMVAPHVLGILIVVVGFVWMIAFHYVVWGRWLSRRVQEQARREASESDSDDSDG